MSTKSTYRFPQYNTKQIAQCIADRVNFETYGNLSGRVMDSANPHIPFLLGYGWEHHHPAWEKHLHDLRHSWTKKVVYAVYSYRTVIAVLVEDLTVAEHRPDSPERYHWEVDAAANQHSTYTAKAFYSFMAAINAPGFWSWHAQSIGSMQDVAPASLYRVEHVGQEWVAYTRLSEIQRQALAPYRGKPVHHSTRRVLKARGILDDRGVITGFGQKVAAYCV